METNWKPRDVLWISMLGFAMAAMTGYLIWRELTPDWKDYQEEFRQLVEKKYGPARAQLLATGIQQIWVKDLGRVDRCVTCHQGMEWKGLEGAAQPYKSHPREILAKHPLNEWGCTVCHGGQGYATDMASAHAVEAEHWEEPLLSGEMAKTYTVSDRKAMLQSHCNSCHRYDRETNGAPVINAAKEIVRNKGCRACHTINNRGGVIGPNLTYIGDLAPEQYDYSRLSGKNSVFAWHISHFKNPKAMSAATVMPDFGFGSKEAQALTLLAMSWKKAELPARYLPPSYTVGDKPTAEEQEKERQMLTGDGAFFVKKGCFICHDVTALGIESAAKIGPDLSIAVTDVQSRFGRTLEDFIQNPTGTMAVVLSTQIILTEGERKQAVERLKLAYERRQEKTAKSAPAKR